MAQPTTNQFKGWFDALTKKAWSQSAQQADVGSGVSSLTYAKELQVDYLKIDGSFIRGVATDEVDHIFVKSVIDIAHLSGIKTIAECVESDEIKKIVKSLGADFGQGYGIDRPTQLLHTDVSVSVKN